MKSILREPLLHFIAIGAALFVWFKWGSGGAGPGSTRIAVTSGQIDHLAASYTKAWRRPPTDAELKRLIDDWVRAVVGIVGAVFVVSALITAAVISLRAPWTRIVVRVAGSWTAATGLLLLGWSLGGRG